MRTLLFLFIVKLFVEAADDDCGVVPKAKWLGGPVIPSKNTTQQTPLDLVVVNHTKTEECITDAECEESLKAIHESLKKSKNVILDSFYIGGNGKVYEGAGWQGFEKQSGSNRRSLMISFIDNLEEYLPRFKAMKAAKELLSCAMKNRHLSDNFHTVRNDKDRISSHAFASLVGKR